MHRRIFISSLGIASMGFVAIPSPISSLKLEEQISKIPPEELKLCFENYCKKVFDSALDINNQSPNGRYFFAESYEVLIHPNQNTIFDFSDEIIKISKSFGFDASALKKGKMPDGMSVGDGGVIISSDGKFSIFKIPGLLNYNSTVKYKNCVNILSSTPPCEWKKIDVLERSKKNSNTYTGNSNGSFKLWLTGEQLINFDIEETKPVLKFRENESHLEKINIEILKKLLSENIIKTINI